MLRLDRRRFLGTTAAFGVMSTLGSSRAMAATDEVNVGFISCGSRARGLMGQFKGLAGVNVAAVCDPDESRVKSAGGTFPRAKQYTDLRKLLDDDSLDAVVVATCNHWHCLAAIWAMEAGKHVYVEKPLSHSQWEGMQTVAAAKQYGKICQLGTQQRSDPMQAEIKKFLHEEKTLGEIQSARVNRYGVRPSIGKRDTPLPIADEVKYDLWLGPAQDEPIFRERLHYDWHWDWNTGSGEMGNWGVHVLDDLRNNVFQDQVKLPKRIFGGGGRLLWDDAGDSPNVHFVYFDTGEIPTVIGLANIKASPDANGSPKHPGPGSGYIAYCEGGRFEGQRGRGRAFDADGKVIKEFRGNSGNGLHQQNFIDAVRQEDESLLNAHVSVGNDSTGWCNLANIAFRAGSDFRWDAADLSGDASEIWSGLLEEMKETMANHSLTLDSPGVKLSPMLNIDPATEQFVGDHAESANRFIKREYRAPYVVPELTKTPV